MIRLDILLRTLKLLVLYSRRGYIATSQLKDSWKKAILRKQWGGRTPRQRW